jgi:hypothetical protein
MRSSTAKFGTPTRPATPSVPGMPLRKKKPDPTAENV